MKRGSIEVHETQFGFNWGDVEVLRTASHLGYKVFTIRTPRRVLDVTTTPSGLLRLKERKCQSR